MTLRDANWLNGHPYPRCTCPFLAKSQISVRHGHTLAPRLGPALASVPPAVWRPVVPQLFSQLGPGQASPEARQLLLGALQGVAAAAPSAVLYPCMVEAQVSESSDRALGPELQVSPAD